MKAGILQCCKNAFRHLFGRFGINRMEIVLVALMNGRSDDGIDLIRIGHGISSRETGPKLHAPGHHQTYQYLNSCTAFNWSFRGV